MASAEHLTHAGAIVMTGQGAARRYLLVRPKDGRSEWLLPKGHIEDGESPEQTAAREVAEEAGVDAIAVQAVSDAEFEAGGETVRVRFFLMRDQGRATPSEARARDWCTFDEAMARLSFEELRRALAAADAVARATDEGGTSYASALSKQLDFLNDRMKEDSQTANAFLAKFLFGGVVAVIALLNADLVLLDESVLSARDAGEKAWLAAAAAIVLGISALYFGLVMKRYGAFLLTRRKLKYKYELTLQACMLPSLPFDYTRFMERSVTKGDRYDGEFSDRVGRDSYAFPAAAQYFLEHHRASHAKKDGEPRSYFWIAMVLVVLTMVVRAIVTIFNAAPA